MQANAQLDVPVGILAWPEKPLVNHSIHASDMICRAKAAGAAVSLRGPGDVADEELTAFSCALRDATVMDAGDGMQLLSLGPGTPFPDDTQGRCGLLVRDFYPRLLQRIEERERVPAALLTGVPGTSKSWWIWFAIHVLLNQSPALAIVWQSFKIGIGTCVLFKDGQAFVGHLGTFSKELSQKSTYFADGVLPQWVQARTVMVCSPELEVYKEFIKGRDIELIMPLWTWPEMQKLWEHLYQDKLDLARVRRNFDLWYGGVPRLVLERPSTTDADGSRDNSVALDAIKSTSIQVEQVLRALEGPYDVGSEASHHVVHQDGNRETFRASGRQFATKNVRDLFAVAAQNRGRGTAAWMKELASPSNPNSCLRGHEADTDRHKVMSSGGCFEYRFADVPCDVPARPGQGRQSARRGAAMKAALAKATADAATAQQAAGAMPGAVLRLSVQKLKEQVVTAGSGKTIGDVRMAAQQFSSSSSLRPSALFGHSRPGIDTCIYPNTLLHFTAAKKKESLDEQVLEDHLQILPHSRHYYLDYIVPAHVYSTFKPAQLKRDAKAHPRVAQTFVRVVKVEAKLRPAARNIPTVQMPTCMVHAVRGASFIARSM